ncbi:hypothetical protein F4804DRAFT_176724 [Jackrogersella minutella]|nr:hypothetical protein F4804DRAFT_176724 [Jackrogersella minutella]
MSTLKSMLDRAQTLPINLDKPVPGSRNQAWTTAKAIPYSRVEQKRVCYPSLEPWRPQDGERYLGNELGATIKELKAKDRSLGLKVKLREKWSIKFEGANRRMEGSSAVVVPTIMVVAWNEDDQDYEADDEALWAEACEDMVAFLRNHGAAYFGVEIIHWDKLDYQVVT